MDVDNNYTSIPRKNLATSSTTATLAELQALVDATPDGYELVLPEAEYVLRTLGATISDDIPGYLTINKNIKISGKRTSLANLSSKGVVLRNYGLSTVVWTNVSGDVWQAARPGGMQSISWEGKTGGFRRHLQYFGEDTVSIAAATVPSWSQSGGNMRIKLGSGVNPNNEILYFGTLSSAQGDQVILVGADVQELELENLTLIGGAERSIAWQNLNQNNAVRGTFRNIRLRHCGVQRSGATTLVNRGQGFQIGGAGRFLYESCVVEGIGWDGFNFKHGGHHVLRNCVSAWCGVTQAIATLASVASSANAISPHYGSDVIAEDCYFGPSSNAVVASVNESFMTMVRCVVEGDASIMNTPVAIDVFDVNGLSAGAHVAIFDSVITGAPIGIRTANGSRVVGKANNNDCSTATSGSGIVLRT